MTTERERDMSLKAVKARIAGYMKSATNMLKNLPKSYQPGADDSSDSEDEGNPGAKRRKKAFEERRKGLIKKGLVGNTTRAASRQELEERFQAKMATLKPSGQRQKSMVKQKKLAKVEEIKEKKKLKKREYNKKREKERNKTRQKGEQKEEGKEGGPVEETVVKEPEAGKLAPQDDQIAFSKFDFADTGHDETTKSANKSLKKVLKALEKTKEKQEKLKKKGDEEGLKTLKEKTSWDNALSKAEGKKVRTDISLVKKTLKKKEIKKKISAKKWNSRLGKEADMQKQRQDKRTMNLQKRKEAKIKKKVKRSIKKGRVVF